MLDIEPLSLGEHEDSPSRYLGGLFLCICSKFAPDNPSCKEGNLTAQRKIPVVLSFPYHRHKAGIASGKQMVRWTFAASGSPLGVARAACFEQLAGVFASCGALHYAKILASLKIKNGISLTPLNCALNALTIALYFVCPL